MGSSPGRDLPVLFRVPKVVAKAPVSTPVAPSVDHTGKGIVKETISSEVARAITDLPTKEDLQPDHVSKSPSPTPVPAQAPVPAPTPAPRPKTKEKSAGWFDNQGKLITVCFLVALMATIYFARSKRQEDPQPIADVPSLDVSLPTASSEVPKQDNWQMPEELERPKRPARDVTAARRRVTEAARAAESSNGAPRADLLPPMDLAAPPLVRGSKDNEPAAVPPVAPAEATRNEGARVAEIPQPRNPGRSSWGAGDLPAPAATTETTPPAGYPPFPATAPPTSPAGTTYPSTDAAPYRYYVPPTTPGAANPLPQGTPTNERSGPGLY